MLEAKRYSFVGAFKLVGTDVCNGITIVGD
jgi:hypothetical protein